MTVEILPIRLGRFTWEVDSIRPTPPLHVIFEKRVFSNLILTFNHAAATTTTTTATATGST